MMKIINRQASLIGRVRTREAPSPTGYPHVGTALQVLFNWIYARRYEGKFIVRIEDTDRKRYVAGSETAILEALDWLGLSPDESPKVGGPYGPYRQSERLELYQKYATQLVETGHAYYCFCSAERLQKMRADQQKKNIPPKYDRHCLKLSAAEIKKKLAIGEKPAIRMKIPDEREIIVHDLLRGEVKFSSKFIDDQVILKSDGFPTYHLGAIVDDHLMKITHMKRGEEWLPSAPKHVLLYEFFGWKQPVMIHMPILRNPDRSKLSKRKGNTSLWWYREQGFLPDALLNFLALLIWKPADGSEIFTKEDMVKVFEWDQLNIAGPIFDVTKLNWLNGVYIRARQPEKLLADVQAWAEWVAKAGQEHTAGAKQLLAWLKQDSALFAKALGLLQERLKILSELPDLLEYYFVNDLVYDREDLLQKQDPAMIKEALSKVLAGLEDLSNWNQPDWEQVIRGTADQLNLKHKIVFMSLRSAVTAREATPPLFEVMQVLGQKESLARVKRAIKFIG